MTVGPDAAVVEEIGPPPTRRDGQRWAAALEEIVELVERRAGDNPHPGWRAPTWPELAATVDERTSHGRWVELPYKTIWTTHAILARAVCEHGRAFALLLRTNPAASLALDTQARTMVELAAQASWLMWPDVGGRAPVARLHVLRRRTAIEHDRLGRHLGLDPDADHPATLAAIDTYAETLGLRYDHGPNGGWTGIEDQPNLGPTERVAWYMEETGKTPKKAMYAYLCGAAHGELWRLTQGYRAVEMPPDQPARWEVRASRDFTATAAMVAVEATVYTGLFAFQLLGMNAATAELAALLPAAQRTLRPLSLEPGPRRPQPTAGGPRPTRVGCGRNTRQTCRAPTSVLVEAPVVSGRCPVREAH